MLAATTLSCGDPQKAVPVVVSLWDFRAHQEWQSRAQYVGCDGCPGKLY